MRHEISPIPVNIIRINYTTTDDAHKLIYRLIKKQEKDMIVDGCVEDKDLITFSTSVIEFKVKEEEVAEFERLVDPDVCQNDYYYVSFRKLFLNCEPEIQIIKNCVYRMLDSEITP